MDIREFVSREKARSDSFRFLAACFYQPEMDILKKELLPNLLKSLEISFEAAAAFAKEALKLLAAYSEKELLVDYAKLFVGPNELLAAPYGSVYLDRDRRVMGDSTMDVIEYYKSHGLVMDEDFREMPDHMAAELEFMYYLVFKEVEAIEKSDMASAIAAIEAQEFFMNKFLRSWTDKFAVKIEETAETGFYKAIAACLSAFIYNIEFQDSLPEQLRAAAISYSV